MNIITKVAPFRPCFRLAQNKLNIMLPKIIGVYCAHEKMGSEETNQLFNEIITSIEVLKNGS